jgi:hypothetical protein
VRDLLTELGFGGDPVAIDDESLLFLSPACDDWGPIVQQHGLSAVIDLEAGLDAGIPANPNQVIYVYFPFRDEDVPTLHKLHAVARLGAELVKARERVLIHCQMGLNRSALVAGLVLVYNGLSGEDAVARLQARRPGALYNEVFAAYLRQMPAGGLIPGATPPSD